MAKVASFGGRSTLIVAALLVALGCWNLPTAGRLKADDAQTPESAVEAVLSRLREAGASQARPQEVRIENVGGWHGTAEDILLVSQLPDLRKLAINFKCVDADVVSRLKLPPLETLTLYGVSDEAVAALVHLPEAKALACYPHSLGNSNGLAPWQLTAVGYRRLAELSGPIQSLHVGWSVTFGFRGIDDQGLAAIATLRSLEKLEIYDGAFTAAGLAQLAGLEKLTDLYLACRPPMRAAELAGLAPLASLRSLVLSGIRCDAQGFQALGRLTRLEKLHLNISQFPDSSLQPADMAVLKDLRNLQEVRIARWDGAGGVTGSPNIAQDALLGDAMLLALSQISTLKSVAINRIGTSPEGVEELVRLPELESLSLCPLALSSRAVTAVGNLPRLRKLSLTDTQTANLNLHDLASCTELTNLSLIQTMLGAETLDPLAQLRSLKSLDLSHSTLRGDIAESVADLKALEELDISETDGILRQEELPKKLKVVNRPHFFIR
jgi:hypothetical protein